MSSHYDRTENFQFLWKIGDLDRAEEEAAKLANEGPKRDRLLYFLEEGAVSRMNSNTDQSIPALNHAAREYERWFGPHLRTETRISEELLSTIGSAEYKPYKSRIYDRVMMRLYQTHNYLLTGDRGRARAEIFKTRQAIQDSKDLWQVELEQAREEAKKQNLNLDKSLEKQFSNHPLHLERKRIQSLVPKNLPTFVNPAALYLEALYFLHTSKEREDFAKAEYSLRQLHAVDPENTWISEDYKLANAGKKSECPKTYIFFETGRAPVRLERRFDLPIFFFSPTARIPYLGVAFPTLQINDQFLQDLEIFTSDQSNNSQKTTLLSDLDAIVAQEFDQYFDIELSKAVAGAVAKGGLQYLATNSVRANDDLTQVAVGAGVGMLSQLTTRADLRSWSTLPKQIRFCKIDTPIDQKLTLRGAGTKLSTDIMVTNKHINLVWVRSVSNFTPLRVVGVCPLSNY